MREKLARFMAGRYGGNDLLNKTLMITIFVLIILQIILPFGAILDLVLSLLVWGMLIWYTFRIFSRNTSKRVAENYAYWTWAQKVKRSFTGRREMFKQRKDYRFFRCPGCKNMLRIPRGKGKVKVHCRQCGHSFDAKT